MYILRAGLTGCLAGLMFPQSTIIEPDAQPKQHKALLRFRSNQIGELLGIEFKKVKVTKGIWYNDSFVNPSIVTNNLYSQKVTGKLNSRSIEDINSVERYIAPEELHEIMLDRLGNRVFYNSTITKDKIKQTEHKISTMPLFDLMDILGLTFISPVTRTSDTIYVNKYQINNCDLYQTIYYPDIDTNVYRATIERNIMTVESMFPIDVLPNCVLHSFGLREVQLDDILHNHVQRLGKMSAIPELERRKVIRMLTLTYGIFSLGRVATWREKVLLDDCYHDIAVIKKLLNSDDYTLSKELT